MSENREEKTNQEWRDARLRMSQFERTKVQDELDTMEERETALLAQFAYLDARIEKMRDSDIMMKALHRTAVEDYTPPKKTPVPGNNIIAPPGIIGEIPAPQPTPLVLGAPVGEIEEASPKKTPGPVHDHFASPPSVSISSNIDPTKLSEILLDEGVFYHGKWDALKNWKKEWDAKNSTGKFNKGESDPHGTKSHEPGAVGDGIADDTSALQHGSDPSADECDPHGTEPHTAGAKLDAGKPLVGLCIGGFSQALELIAEVTTHGASKYLPDGWKKVPDGENRYKDALYRHLLAHERTPLDSDSGLPHLAQAAWNVLAWLELVLRRQKSENAKIS